MFARSYIYKPNGHSLTRKRFIKHEIWDAARIQEIIEIIMRWHVYMIKRKKMIKCLMYILIKL